MSTYDDQMKVIKSVRLAQKSNGKVTLTVKSGKTYELAPNDVDTLDNCFTIDDQVFRYDDLQHIGYIEGSEDNNQYLDMILDTQTEFLLDAKEEGRAEANRDSAKLAYIEAIDNPTHRKNSH